jgi:hypothetical protein
MVAVEHERQHLDFAWRGLESEGRARQRIRRSKAADAHAYE